MLKLLTAVAAGALASAALAQSAPEPAVTPAPVAEPMTPAAPAASGAGATTDLPRCSAQLRDRCRQDERFASDVWRPGRSRDNNAMHYPSSAAAERRDPR
jgi:hypothetical protein